MNTLRVAAVCALFVPSGCGGTSSPPANPTPAISSGPLTSASETIAPAATATTAPLPSIGGVYGGQIILPPGSGTATLTFSVNPPSGVPALPELTPSPQIAYLTIKAQSPFNLASQPGLNLAVPTAYMGTVMWLDYGGSVPWSGGQQQLGWPSTVAGTSTMCFKPQGGAISLAVGQSVYLGITGDNVLPLPPSSGTPPACPQS